VGVEQVSTRLKYSAACDRSGGPTLSVEISVMSPTGAARSRSRMSVFAPGIFADAEHRQ
jgi:hypothetical protein